MQARRPSSPSGTLGSPRARIAMGLSRAGWKPWRVSPNTWQRREHPPTARHGGEHGAGTNQKGVRQDEQRRYKRLRPGQWPQHVLRAPWGRPSARAAPWRVRHHRELLRRAAAGARATDGKTLMTMVQRGFPSAELRDEHRAGLPNAFARLEQAI